jgi:transglutaminase-like putative cysteine protease
MASRRSSDVAAFALAALSAAAALALGQVFRAGDFAVPVLGAALAPHALGLVGRRLRWSIATTLSVSFVGLFAYVVWALEPGTTAYGLPTASTLETIARHLGDGFEALRTAKAPAPVTDGAVVLAVVAVWAMAQGADMAAFHRGATVGAIAPALGLFVWAASLGTDTLSLSATVLFAAATVVFLLLQHQSLLERRRSRFAGRRFAAGSGLLGFGIVIGAFALVAGAVVAPALPGADSDALLDVTGLGEGSGLGSGSYRTEPPLAVLGENFQRGEPIELFTVDSDREEYWRIAALDRYTSDQGGQWTLSAQGEEEVSDGLDEPVGAGVLDQTYRISGLEGRWMPAVFEARQVEGGDPLVVLASTTLVTGDDSVRGLEYDVRSSVPRPPDQVTDAQRQETAAPVPAALVEYTELPTDLPASVRDRAQLVTAGAATPYDAAVALESFFSPENGFQYSLDVDLGATAQSTSAIASFLRDRVGFCVQFAGTYAVMARAAGLPARVAVGYTPGTYDPSVAAFRVTTDEAHAWPEVWLAGLGWTRFEPTPPGGLLPGGSDLPGRIDPTPPATTVTTSAAAGSDASTGTAPPRNPEGLVSIDAPTGGANDGGGGSGTSLSFRLVVMVLGVLAIGGAVVAGSVVVRKERRRAERRRRVEPADAVAGAWEQALDALLEAGEPPRPAFTPLELAHDSEQRVPAAGPPLRDLAERWTATCYAPDPPTPESAAAAWKSVDALRAGLDAMGTRYERFRRRIDPGPLRASRPAAGPPRTRPARRRTS